MTTQTQFVMAEARPLITRSLQKAGFDISVDPTEPELLEARRDRGTDVTSIVVDSGGQLRFTRARQVGAETDESRVAGKHTLQITRRTDETIIVSCQVDPADMTSFNALLATLDKV